MLARLSRLIPFLIILAIIEGVIYVVVTFKYSSNKAKEVLIRIFTWLTIVLIGVNLIITLYGWFEDNQAVLELAGSFAITAAIGLGITQICRAVFIKNHPSYKFKQTSPAAIINPQHERIKQLLKFLFSRR